MNEIDGIVIICLIGALGTPIVAIVVGESILGAIVVGIAWAGLGFSIRILSYAFGFGDS